MGKVVPFARRLSPTQVESALLAAGDQLQRRMRARDELPRLLAALIEAGEKEMALQVVHAWGREEADPAELLEVCRTAAAVVGVREE